MVDRIASHFPTYGASLGDLHDRLHGEETYWPSCLIPSLTDEKLEVDFSCNESGCARLMLVVVN